MSLVSQWMAREVKTVSPDQTVLEACVVMRQYKIGCVVVTEGKKPVGMFTERDMVTRVGAEGVDVGKTLVKEVMSANLITATTSTQCDQMYNLMRAREIRHLPIVENDVLLGIISIRDLVRFHMHTVDKTIVDLSNELSFIRGVLDETGEERVKSLYYETKKLEALVVKDSLTGLYNYRFFQETIVDEIARAKKFNYPVCLLFIDIDNFKEYNDKNGHESGNVLLKQLADLLRRTSRTTRLANPAQMAAGNDTVARYGGEEFVVILPETDKKGALVKANRILNDVRNYPFAHREKQDSKKMSVSIGIAEFPVDGSTWDEVVRKADEALYKAKFAGKDQVM